MTVERWIYTVPLRLRSLFRRVDVDRELQDELDAHVDALTAQFVARGMARDLARTEALRAVGGIERRKDEMRDAQRVEPVTTVMRDIRYALRGFARAPAFTLVAVLTLALGTGANAAIFTVVNAVLLRPLGYGHPEQLVVVEHRTMESTVPAEVLRWRRDSLRSFSDIASATIVTTTLTGRGDPEQLGGMRLSASMFPMLQVAPMLGRVFTESETHTGRDNVAVLSYDFWRRRLGSDVQVVGQLLTLDGVPRTIIGVMPRDFRFAPYWATHPDLWLPMTLDGAENDWDTAALRTIARLRAGVDVDQAQRELAAVGLRTRQAAPAADERLIVRPLQEKVTGPVKAELWLLSAAVGLVLLIACANVMHLQLMRSTARERESAVRLSLGASRRRLIQQLLTESLLLSLAGAVVGLILASLGVRALIALAPHYIPRLDTIRIDARVFGFMFLVAALTGMVSGSIPALAAAHVDPSQTMRQSGRGASDSQRRRRLGAALVVSEFAMAVILLIGAGLVLRSFASMLGLDPGFDPRHVTTMQVAVRGTRDAEPARRNPFYSELTQRLQALPGVESVSAINHLPLHGDSWGFSFWTEQNPLATRENQPHAYFRLVRPGYFSTMHVALISGRDITDDDAINRNHVVVIDQTLAQQTWPHDNAIGKRISVDDPSHGAEWFTVVAIVRDVQQASWSPHRQGEMFYPYWQQPAGSAPPADMHFANLLSPNSMTFVVRGQGNTASIAAAVRKTVAALDADAPVADVIAMEDAVAEQVAEPKFYLVLLGGFAVVALVLAAVGVYGVLSFVVSSRQREIGIRLALGAPRTTPLRLALDQGIRLALAGSLCGVAGAFVLTRYLRVLLWGVGPTDPITFVAVPLLLVAVAALACYIPARRASRVSPMTVLRGE